MSRNSCFHKSIAVLVILAVLGFGAASLVTLHYHILINGLVVVHSHPLRGDSPRKNHDHSKQQYAELNATTHLLETIVLPPDLDGFIDFPFVSQAFLESNPILVSVTAWHPSPRAPPFVVVSS